jgi:hypothetical protein
VVPADFMFCFGFNISGKMLYAEVLSGICLENHCGSPALTALHLQIPL